MLDRILFLPLDRRYDTSVHLWGHGKENKLLGLSAIDVRPLCAMSTCQTEREWGRGRHCLLRSVEGVMASSGRWQTACVWVCDGEIRPLRSLGDVHRDLSCCQGPSPSVHLTTTLKDLVFLSPWQVFALVCMCIWKCICGCVDNFK